MEVWVFFLIIVSRGYSLVEVRGLLIVVASLVAERRLQEVWHVGSVAAAPGSSSHRLNSRGTQLRCSEACGILLDQGWNRRLMHWQVNSLSLSHQGSPEAFFFFFKYLFLFTYLVVQGLSCDIWDLVPQPGIKPRAPALRDQSLSHWTTRGDRRAQF